MRPLKHGYTNRTVGDETTVRKIYRGPDAALRLDLEHRLLRRLRGRLPVPPVHAVDGGSLTLGLLPGAPGQELLDAGHAAAVLEACGELLGRVHRVPVSVLEPTESTEPTEPTELIDSPAVDPLGADPDAGRPAAGRSAAGRSAAGRLDTGRSAAGRPAAGRLDTGRPEAGAVLVHGDFGPQNALLDPDTLRVTGLVDWEFAHAGEPVEDLAWCEWIVRAHHPEHRGALDHFHHAYGGPVPPWPERRATMLARCVALRDFCQRWEPDGGGARQWEDRARMTAAWGE